MKPYSDPTDLQKRDFSLAVITAKPLFIDWLAKRAASANSRPYRKEDDLVAFIPNADLFTGHSSKPIYGSYEQFLAKLKPRLLRAELATFGVTSSDLGNAETEETLNKFFDVSFRDTALGISAKLNDKLEHLDTIDLAKRDFSLALIEPKQALFTWLDDFAKVVLKGKFTASRLYPTEHRSVILIPKVSRFAAPSALTTFLDALKPTLISIEIEQFGRDSRREFDYADTKETFDAFFELRIRDTALFISDLMK